jgi:AcrR family transcriptional regulator
MTQQSAGATKAAPGARPRRRLNADARKSLILKAARRAFTESGDMSGTTIRTIAEKAGISEGLIYRHFESKEQLYVEAVVEPLREVVDVMVAQAEAVQETGVPAAGKGIQIMADLNNQLIATVEEVLPLLGLVLFGDPALARRFYRQNFAVAMDRMAESWETSLEGLGFQADNADVAVRAVMGICLIFALESRYNPKFDRMRAVQVISEGVARGFLPPDAFKRRRGRN